MTGSSLARSLAAVVLLWCAIPNANANGPSRQLTPNTSSLNFGQVTVGMSSPLSVTVTNTGSGNVNLKQATISGASFTLKGPMLPLNLSPGRSTSFTVTFAPGAAVTAAGTLSLVSNAMNSPTSVGLAGSGVTGTGQLTPNPTQVNFGTVMVGTTSTQSVTVSNTGTGSATVSQDSISGTGFSVSGLPAPMSLAPGQSVSLSVKFAPTAAGTANGQITVSGTASNSPIGVPVSGSAQSAPSASGQIAVNPTSLSFGNVTVNTSSSQPVAILNTGTGNTTISSANVTGSGFSVSGLPLPLTLTPGQGTAFQVNFDPPTTGTLAGSVSLVSDASSSPNTVPFSGFGVLAHSVNLSWTASTSTVSGYNVYRASQSGGPYTRMNSTVDTSTVYTDSTVQSGQTYYYVTTAVEASGSESPYSNQVPAVVPTP